MEFHLRVAEALSQVGYRERNQAAKARKSVRAAQDQHAKISPGLTCCEKFIRLWQDDLEEWRSYLGTLPRLDSLMTAFKYLDIEPATCLPTTGRYWTDELWLG